METFSKNKLSGWNYAVQSVKLYLKTPQKADAIIASLPDDISCHNRKVCQFLFLGMIRHKLLIEAIIAQLTTKKPKPLLYAVLCVATYEIIESTEATLPKIVHHAVHQAKSLLSAREVQFVNAILRKVHQCHSELINPSKVQDSTQLSIQYSHPKWLVDKWVTQFGQENTIKLLEWNQSPSPVYFRLRDPSLFKNKKIPGLPTQWEHFFIADTKHWSDVLDLVHLGQIYIQDPLTVVGPKLLGVHAGDSVLDICAAPGGKSMLFAENLGSDDLLVAIDLPSPRLNQLKENFAKIKTCKTKIIAHDLLELTPEALSELNVPTQYTAVFIDVPCSNTGVLRRRPDVKWRLQPGEVERVATLQYSLLNKAAEFVSKGGRLVYSTCSIEDAEDKAIVERFLEEQKGEFTLSEGHTTYPWESNHDGGCAYLLSRKA